MITKLIIMVIVLIPISLIGDMFVRRKFNIEKRKGRVRSVNKIQTGIEIALFIVYLIGIWFALDYNIFFYMLGFFSIIYLFRAFMHWKYDHEKKYHILYFYDFLMILVIMPIAYFWIFV